MGCGIDDFGPKLQKFGFQFCPQGFRLAAPHGTSTLTNNWPKNFKMMICTCSHCFFPSNTRVVVENNTFAPV